MGVCARRWTVNRGVFSPGSRNRFNRSNNRSSRDGITAFQIEPGSYKYCYSFESYSGIRVFKAKWFCPLSNSYTNDVWGICYLEAGGYFQPGFGVQRVKWKSDTIFVDDDGNFEKGYCVPAFFGLSKAFSSEKIVF